MRPADPAQSPGPEVDTTLLAGFTFGCRPECGLCCFTSPRLEGDDERRLRLIAPAVPIVAGERAPCVASWPNGGACRLLSDLRCSAHAARPAPCREFPVSVHLGTRLQATVVLSCPGLPLDPLRTYGPTLLSRPFTGLDTELKSVRDRITPSVERLRRETIRRRRRVVRELSDEGRWVEEAEVRDRLVGHGLIPSGEEYAPSELPPAETGLEVLPMYYDGRKGPVVLTQGSGGWTALELFPRGGSRAIGVAVPSGERPALDRSAEELLEGYLRYWLARDGFLAAAHLEMLSVREGSVVDVALSDLHAIGSDVLARGAVRARLRGESGVRLASADIEQGIRATDQDWLDRPTWGMRL